MIIEYHSAVCGYQTRQLVLSRSIPKSLLRKHGSEAAKWKGVIAGVEEGENPEAIAVEQL